MSNNDIIAAVLAHLFGTRRDSNTKHRAIVSCERAVHYLVGQHTASDCKRIRRGRSILQWHCCDLQKVRTDCILYNETVVLYYNDIGIKAELWKDLIRNGYLDN
jgi:hypothetical protein